MKAKRHIYSWVLCSFLPLELILFLYSPPSSTSKNLITLSDWPEYYSKENVTDHITYYIHQKVGREHFPVGSQKYFLNPHDEPYGPFTNSLFILVVPLVYFIYPPIYYKFYYILTFIYTKDIVFYTYFIQQRENIKRKVVQALFWCLVWAT